MDKNMTEMQTKKTATHRRQRAAITNVPYTKGLVYEVMYARHNQYQRMAQRQPNTPLQAEKSKENIKGMKWQIMERNDNG